MFIGLYISLNTLYGFYIESFGQQSDPVTEQVSKQVAVILSVLTDQSVQSRVLVGSRNVLIGTDQKTVIAVFEGCNGINVMIVFLSFVIAFRGTVRTTLWFSLIGLVIIYLVNLMRIGMLYGVAIYFPNSMYFFHKYLFTGIIYGIVFFMWYLWIKRVRLDSH